MPGKIARSAPRPPFGPPPCLASREARKSLLFTPVRESSGECRLQDKHTQPWADSHCCALCGKLPRALAISIFEWTQAILLDSARHDRGVTAAPIFASSLGDSSEICTWLLLA
jgi:hypothetical protein